MIKQLKKILPDKFKVAVKNFFNSPNVSGWFGSYSSWAEVSKECEGYNDSSIPEKIKASVLKVKSGEAAYERDSVLFSTLYLFEPMVNAFKASIASNYLHVLDFGGSLGSSYFQHKQLFNGLEDFKWTVVEQPQFVEIGKKEIAENHLSFEFTIEEALKNQSAQVLLLSSVLQYIKEPYELIEKLLTYKFEYIIIDRTAFIESKTERLTKQIVPVEIYKASYPAWFFNETKFKNTFFNDYNLVNTFINDIPSPMILDNENVSWKGFYFRRKND